MKKRRERSVFSVLSPFMISAIMASSAHAGLITEADQVLLDDTNLAEQSMLLETAKLTQVEGAIGTIGDEIPSIDKEIISSDNADPITDKTKSIEITKDMIITQDADSNIAPDGSFIAQPMVTVTNFDTGKIISQTLPKTQSIKPTANPIIDKKEVALKVKEQIKESKVKVDIAPIKLNLIGAANQEIAVEQNLVPGTNAELELAAQALKDAKLAEQAKSEVVAEQLMDGTNTEIDLAAKALEHAKTAEQEKPELSDELSDDDKLAQEALAAALLEEQGKQEEVKPETVEADADKLDSSKVEETAGNSTQEHIDALAAVAAGSLPNKIEEAKTDAVEIKTDLLAAVLTDGEKEIATEQISIQEAVIAALGADVEAEEVAGTTDSKEVEKLKLDLETAKSDLAEAKKALGVSEEKYITAANYFEKASCEQKNETASLRTELEEFKSGVMGQISEMMTNMMGMFQMAMKMNQQQIVPPIVERGYANIPNGSQVNVSNQMGLNLLSLQDMYNASSMGGITINNYTANGGNVIAGNYSATNGAQMANRANQNPNQQFDFDPAARQRVAQTIAEMPHSFNFGNRAVQNSERFSQLDAHNSKGQALVQTQAPVEKARATAPAPRGPATKVPVTTKAQDLDDRQA